MLISTTDTVAGYEISETLGVVRGNTVRARNIGRDITQGLRNVVGGELKSYTGLLSDAREEAIVRMEAQAEDLGADAVVSVRFVTAEVTQGAAEILAYGTAVKLAGMDASGDTDESETEAATGAETTTEDLESPTETAERIE
nr:YbjQ family protein [Salinirubrum litoreum]